MASRKLHFNKLVPNESFNEAYEYKLNEHSRVRKYIVSRKSLLFLLIKKVSFKHNVM